MTNLTKGITALLLVLAVANAGQQTIYVYETFHHLFFKEGSVSHSDRVLAPVRQTLKKQKLLRLGYRAEPGVAWEFNAADYYMVQYSLAPIVLRPHKDDDHWVLMNYSKTQRPFPAPDLACVEDFGYGLALYEKGESSDLDLDLGTVWLEQEGPWVGTWTRQENSKTFDAVWKGPDGQEIKDEITFESLTCHKVILSRKGTRGFYHGKLSYDSKTIENGTADWFSAADSWSATIIRK